MRAPQSAPFRSKTSCARRCASWPELLLYDGHRTSEREPTGHLQKRVRAPGRGACFDTPKPCRNAGAVTGARPTTSEEHHAAATRTSIAPPGSSPPGAVDQG